MHESATAGRTAPGQPHFVAQRSFPETTPFRGPRGRSIRKPAPDGLRPARRSQAEGPESLRNAAWYNGTRSRRAFSVWKASQNGIFQASPDWRRHRSPGHRPPARPCFSLSAFELAYTGGLLVPIVHHALHDLWALGLLYIVLRNDPERTVAGQ